MHTVQGSVAPSTLTQYARVEWARRKFAQALSVDPSTPLSLVSFLLDKHIQGASRSSLAVAKASFLFFGGNHISEEVPEDLSRALVRCAAKCISKVPTPDPPPSAICEHLDRSDASRDEVRMGAFVVLSMGALLRVSEATALLWEDVTEEESPDFLSLTLFIKKAKNDHSRLHHSRLLFGTTFRIFMTQVTIDAGKLSDLIASLTQQKGPKVHSVPALSNLSHLRQAELNCKVLNFLERARDDPSAHSEKCPSAAQSNPEILAAYDKYSALQDLTGGSSESGLPLAAIALLAGGGASSSSGPPSKRSKRDREPASQPFPVRPLDAAPSRGHSHSSLAPQPLFNRPQWCSNCQPLATPSITAGSQSTTEGECRSGQAPFMSLRGSIPVWEAFGAAPFVLSILAHGYRLPFPEGFDCDQVNLKFPGNRRSAETNADFVTMTIREWVQSGIIVAAGSTPPLLSPLSVADSEAQANSRSFALNKFIPTTRFRIDDLKSIWDSLPEGGYLALFDLKSGYRGIRFQKVHGFTWKGQNYRTKALPFGLNCAPWVFTKVFRTLVIRWRSMGIQCALYLDDCIITAPTEAQCLSASNQVRNDLREVGAIVAEDKTNWTPAQSETKGQGTIAFHKSPPIPLPSLHQRQIVTGTIASTSLLTGATRDDSTRVPLTAQCQMKNGTNGGSRIEESALIRPREKRVEILGVMGPTSRPFAHSPGVDDFIIEIDASSVALGAVLRGPKGLEENGARSLDESQIPLSSTHRELLAIEFGLKAFLSHVSGSSVRIFCDNQAAVLLARCGSAKDILHEIALEIHETSRKARITLELTWIPRDMNVEADSASLIDLFADKRTSKCTLFLSRGAEIDSKGIDAFALPGFWQSARLSWCVPPPSALNRVVRMARESKAKMILGFPLWFGNPGIVSLRKGPVWSSEILDAITYPKGAPILIPSQLPNSLFASKFFPSPFTFLLCQF
uniref:Reverse transcriptase domain-containing protein n=1 Tax=Pristionchus pacificus TaxID=54126 RepID=A0A8R1YX06_PRIPA